MNQAKQKRQAAQQAFRESLNQLDNILGGAIVPAQPQQPEAQKPKER